jgi:hypothetical protein
MDGNIDPAVLASLPPSMQLDLLAQVINYIYTISLQHVKFHGRFRLFNNVFTCR